MKTNILLWLPGIIILNCLLFISCGKEETAEVKPLSIYAIPVTDTIPTVIAEDVFISHDRKWYVKGLVYIVNEASLHIDSGTVIKMLHDPAGNENFPVSGIVVTRGAKIVARGGRNNPILFSIADPLLYKPTAWNGIIILGKAPSGRRDFSLSCYPWINGGMSYGGSLPDDSSGILQNIKMETNINYYPAGIQNFPSGLQLINTGRHTIVKDVEIFTKESLKVNVF